MPTHVHWRRAGEVLVISVQLREAPCPQARRGTSAVRRLRNCDVGLGRVILLGTERDSNHTPVFEVILGHSLSMLALVAHACLFELSAAGGGGEAKPFLVFSLPSDWSPRRGAGGTWALWLSRVLLLVLLLAISKSDEPSFDPCPVLTDVLQLLSTRLKPQLVGIAASGYPHLDAVPTHVSCPRSDWLPRLRCESCVRACVRAYGVGLQHAMRCSAAKRRRQCLASQIASAVGGGGGGGGGGIPRECVVRLPLSFLCLSLGPQYVLPLIPTTWLLAPSYHFPPLPPLFLGYMVPHPADRSPASCYRSVVCEGGGGRGGGMPGAEAAPGSNHHDGCSSSWPFLFVSPREPVLRPSR